MTTRTTTGNGCGDGEVATRIHNERPRRWRILAARAPLHDLKEVGRLPLYE